MLTDAKCRSASCAPDKKRTRFTDASGLYLEISPAGSKRWFWKVYAEGKEKRLALGSYPNVSLTAARKARDTAKLQKSEGIGRQAKERHLVLAGRSARHAIKKIVTGLDEVVQEFWAWCHLKTVVDQGLGVVDQAVKAQLLVAQDGDEAASIAATQQAPRGRGETAFDGGGIGQPDIRPEMNVVRVAA